MAGSFDPYQAWLKIPAGEQPPHHYRLLGVPLYEANGSVISLAADRQISFLESVDDDEHGFLAQQLIQSIEAARTCLLDEPRKGTYDAKLRAKLSNAAPRPAPAPAPKRVVRDSPSVESTPIPLDESADEPADPSSDWMSPAQPAEKPRPKPAAAPQRAPVRPTAQPAPDAAMEDEANAGDDESFSFLPTRRESGAQNISSSTPQRSAKHSRGAGRPAPGQSIGNKSASQNPGTKKSRMAAIFLPSAITGVILIAAILYMTGDNGEKKAHKTKSSEKPAGTAANTAPAKTPPGLPPLPGSNRN